MKVTKTDIEGVLIIEPRLFNDARGYFFESYNRKNYEEAGITADFVQDNESCSTRGVMRGLHFQRPPYAQAKLVRCVKGKVLDVAVDIRKGSPTYGQHVAVELSEEITASSSYREVSPTDLPYSPIQRCSNTNVTITIIPKPTAASPFRTTPSASTGR